MKVGSRLTIRAFPVKELNYGNENRIDVMGMMTVDTSAAEKLLENEPLVKDIKIRIIYPNEHEQHTNTIMDVIPVSTKALGKVGEGITHTLTGVYIILTGIDEDGHQVCNFGASDGRLAEKIAWGMPGTPLETDLLISFDVVLKSGSWTERAGVDAAHRACDRFCQVFREQLKKFNGAKCAEQVTYQEDYDPDKKDVFIMKEVSGQGAVYDTRLFASEPCGFEGGKSIIDMGCMPVMLTPNEYRDGIMRAMD